MSFHEKRKHALPGTAQLPSKAILKKWLLCSPCQSMKQPNIFSGNKQNTKLPSYENCTVLLQEACALSHSRLKEFHQAYNKRDQ